MTREAQAYAPVHFSLTQFVDIDGVDFGAGMDGKIVFSLSDGPDKTKCLVSWSRRDRTRLSAGLAAIGSLLVMSVSMRACAGLLLSLSLLVPAAHGAAQAEGPSGPSGLPLPRFVSLKSERVNVRAGPTKNNDVSWVYTRAGLPVEITAEYENWRRIRDWEGAEGWVLQSLLSGRRTALVSAKVKPGDDLLPLHAAPDPDSAVTAKLQVGVLASIKRCSGSWCRIAGEGFDGWIEQSRLWGVYPDEKID
jgi:SH3-like domain-containing protein